MPTPIVASRASGLKLDTAMKLAERIGDLVLRAALGVFLAAMAGANTRKAVESLWNASQGRSNALGLADGVSALAVALFAFLVLWLFLVRLPPIDRCAGLKPWAVAFFGTFLQIGIALFPRAIELPLPLKYLSSGLTLGGSLLAVVILAELGRSFSITPQARRLVTTGAYSVVRHPLYVAELLATLGLAIQFLSAGALAVMACQFACQLLRMRYEEQVLRRAFPGYADYARRTARLIPGLY